MRDREADKKSLMTEDNRKAALWMVDAWADLAQRKNQEAEAAYALANEHRAQLDGLIEARNHCKRQTEDVSNRLLSLKTWLRDEHPEIYKTIPERVG